MGGGPRLGEVQRTRAPGGTAAQRHERGSGGSGWVAGGRRTESLEKATVRTVSVCPSSFRSSFCVAMSKTLTAPSAAPQATLEPSGEMATLMQNLPPVCSVCVFSPPSTLHRLTLPPWLPDATVRPSALRLTVQASTGPASMTPRSVPDSRSQRRMCESSALDAARPVSDTETDVTPSWWPRSACFLSIVWPCTM